MSETRPGKMVNLLPRKREMEFASATIAGSSRVEFAVGGIPLDLCRRTRRGPERSCAGSPGMIIRWRIRQYQDRNAEQHQQGRGEAAQKTDENARQDGPFRTVGLSEGRPGRDREGGRGKGRITRPRAPRRPRSAG